MYQKVYNQIKAVDGKISILIDESTMLSNLSTLIIYLKCETSKSEDIHFMFLDLVELSDQCASGITDSLLQSLNKFKFDDDYLKRNLVAFASDGASTKLGKKSGVASLILHKCFNIIVWHCLNYRLELAVGDAVKDVTGIYHFQIFMDKLYTLYNRSPKNKIQLKECAEKVDEQLKKIDRIFDVRLVASSFQSVPAVWDNFQSLCLHFESASTDI